jgi:guanosine-3',5'-bis(diphosphate) 3'-pyrophosphohydrolase
MHWGSGAVSQDYAGLLAAISFAAHKHRDQRRKDAAASPYINHPLALAHVLATEGGVTDLKTLMAAVLHDTVEDTETTYGELVDHFGTKVADVVMEVTDDKSLAKADRKRAQIEHAPHMTKRATRVKLADKICNLRDVAHNPPADWPLARRQEYFDWAKAVVDGLPQVNKRLLKAFQVAFDARP